ncbi:hypothetical protein EXIGLDRAFT_834999 [Exidia glandulosa HHB12029]|uniref:Uncharacterized protein n=1 Tax=Exidia glandulosa HHB12029 TaxID=1314781 RepID=A0A165GKJ1_EXIGL|nr:hypothetical protein EXIGLDRAFT_837657 [Exidia glandulosa HHB12029]KZV94481.1 hypothetical protein EXIGLDRAFT_834999 [Exidia glandulosa HHB12029]
MNSPPNPGSPSSSATSLSDGESDQNFAQPLSGASAATGAPTSSASTTKRRLGPSTPTKSRKLDRERQQRGAGSSLALGGEGSGASAAARAKEELLDQNVLEQFKKDYGDPFDDTVLQSSA